MKYQVLMTLPGGSAPTVPLATMPQTALGRAIGAAFEALSHGPTPPKELSISQEKGAWVVRAGTLSVTVSPVPETKRPPGRPRTRPPKADRSPTDPTRIPGAPVQSGWRSPRAAPYMPACPPPENMRKGYVVFRYMREDGSIIDKTTMAKLPMMAGSIRAMLPTMHASITPPPDARVAFAFFEGRLQGLTHL